MNRSVISSYARTPFGKIGGSLSSMKATELGAAALKAAVSRSGLSPDGMDMVIMGQVLSGGCGQIPARQAAVQAGIPVSVPAEQVNKVCASGLRAVTMADQIIRAGDAGIIAAGGMESMSNAPYISYDMRWGHKMFSTEFTDMMVNDGLWCPAYDCHMAVHGGNAALEYGISREMQDQWAVESQSRAQEAIENGYLCEEIVPVLLKDGRRIECDEAPRKNVSLETLKKMQPLFTSGNTVTAGNAPGVNDGASALVVMDEKMAEQRNIDAEAVILASEMYSEDPKYIATVPGRAVRKLLKKVNMQMDDIDLFEINEAFAAVVLVSCKIMDCDQRKVNVSGGAIAFGHPIGASGGRILMTLIRELQRRNLHYGIAAICSGMGQGDAVLVENCKYKQTG